MKIEVGHYYLNKEGKTVYISQRYWENGDLFFGSTDITTSLGNTNSYRLDGTCTEDGVPDLVEEYTRARNIV